MADEEPPPTEAEEYFSALDYAIPGPIYCDNCGYEMDRNLTHLHKLSRARKCSTEMAMQIARYEPPPQPLPQAFKIQKPSWIERLLRWMR